MIMNTSTYKLMPEWMNIIQRIDADGEVYSIPPDPANTDYQQYLEWVSQGNTPIPPDPIPEPEPLTPQQKLEQSGLTVEELKELLGL
jgi:hypothetical protein